MFVFCEGSNVLMFSCLHVIEHTFRKRFPLLLTIVSGSVGQLTHIAIIIIICGCESGEFVVVALLSLSRQAESSAHSCYRSWRVALARFDSRDWKPAKRRSLKFPVNSAFALSSSLHSSRKWACIIKRMCELDWDYCSRESAESISGEMWRNRSV